MKRKLQIITTVLLLISMVIVLVPVVSANTIFTVTASNLHLRTGGAATYASMGTYPFGTQVDMLRHNTGENAFSEVRIRASGRTGWMSTQFLAPLAETTPPTVPPTTTPPPTTNVPNPTNIEAFPLSYRHLIQNLISARPNWIFVPFNTGLDWNHVIRNQTLPLAPGRSLVPANSPASWRVDGATAGVEPGWAQASEAIVRFQMDPRNFLNDNDVFQFELLRFDHTIHTATGVDAVLNGTFMHSSRGRVLENGQTYAQAFHSIGQEINVSPFHLASRVRLEQGVNGTSGLISGTVSGFPGVFNYFNIGATGTTTQAIINNGLTRAHNEGWTTRISSLRGGAHILSNNFILRGQDTLYLQKFNVVPESGRLFWGQYMTNIIAPLTEGRSVRTGYANTGNLNNNFVFRIPVFNNMPHTPEPLPGAASATIFNGIDFGAIFDFEFYRDKYLDLARAFGSNQAALLAHFVTTGMDEGRQAARTFDVHFYRNNNPDLVANYGDNLRAFYMHFLNQGIYEGRQASALFNVNGYRNANPDLRLAFGYNLRAYFVHFITIGFREGRCGLGLDGETGPGSEWISLSVHNGIDYAAVYDFMFLRNRYSDLNAAFGNDEVAMLRHFVSQGMREGRVAHPDFNVHVYRNRYPDLRAAFGDNLVSYFMHFINSGRHEGRTASGDPNDPANFVATTIHNGVDFSAVFCFHYYSSLNPDVREAFGNDDLAVLRHFVNSGMGEGRIAHPYFNVHIYRNRYTDLQDSFGDNLPSYFMHFINQGRSEGRIGY